MTTTKRRAADRRAIERAERIRQEFACERGEHRYMTGRKTCPICEEEL